MGSLQGITDPFSWGTFWHVTVGKAQAINKKLMTDELYLAAYESVNKHIAISGMASL